MSVNGLYIPTDYSYSNISTTNASIINLTVTTFNPVNVDASNVTCDVLNASTANISIKNTSTVNASTANITTVNMSNTNVSTGSAIQYTINNLILPSNGLYNDATIQTLGDQMRIKAGASNSIGFLTDTDINMVYDGDLNISSNLNASTINTSELNGDVISSNNQLNVRNSTGKKFTMRHDGDEIHFYGALNNNSQPSNYLFYTDAGGVNSSVKLKINKNTDVVEVISLEATDNIITGNVICDDVNTSICNTLEINTSLINASVSNVSTKNVSFLTANTISTTNTSSTNVSTQDVFIYDKNGGGTFSQIERTAGNDFTIKHTNNTDIKIYSNNGSGIPVIQIQGGSDIVEIPQVNAVELNGTTINTDGNLNASNINTSLINTSSTHSSNISNFLLNSSLGYIDVVNSTSVNSSTINASDLNVSNFNTTTLNSSSINSSSLNSSNISCVNISCSSVVEGNLHSSKTYELFNSNKTSGITDLYSPNGDGIDGIGADIIYPAFKKESGTYTDYNILNMMAFNNNNTKSNRFIDVPATMNCSLIEYDLIEGDTINTSTINASDLNVSNFILPSTLNTSTINSSFVNSSLINYDNLEGDTINTSTINASDLNVSNFNLPPSYNASTINSSYVNSSLIEYDLAEGDTLNCSTINASDLNVSNFILPSTLNTSTLNSSTVNTNQLYVAPDTNTDVDIGKATVGYVGWSNLAGFSHIDNATTTNYALLQSGTGQTYLNSKSGQNLNLRINNLDAVVIDTNKNATFKEDVKIEGALDYKANIYSRTHGNNTGLQATGTIYYPEYSNFAFNGNSNIFGNWVTPTGSSSSGLQILKTGVYRIECNQNFHSEGYNDRFQVWTRLVVNNNTILESSGFCYGRNYSNIRYAQTRINHIISLTANDWIKIDCTLAKNTPIFGQTWNSGGNVDRWGYDSFSVTFLGV